MKRPRFGGEATAQEVGEYAKLEEKKNKAVQALKGLPAQRPGHGENETVSKGATKVPIKGRGQRKTGYGRLATIKSR